jgi:hypothetical protein
LFSFCFWGRLPLFVVVYKVQLKEEQLLGLLTPGSHPILLVKINITSHTGQESAREGECHL